MATITPSAPGTVTPFTASGGGDTIALGNATNNVRIVIINGSGSSVTVTLTAVNKCSQGFLHDQTATVAAGATANIIPLPQVIDTTAANHGNILMGYSSATSVTGEVFAS